MSSKYYLVQSESNDLKVFMCAEAMHIGKDGRLVTVGKLCEAAVDIDAHEVFHTLATMQHKLLCSVDTPRLDSDNIEELESMFETSAETLALFNMLLVKLGKGSEAFNDVVNAAQKAFDEHIEELLKDKKNEEEKK